MRILLAVISYRFLTGAEMYCYELTRELAGRGHTVAVTSPRVGGEIAERTRRLGVEVFPLEDCPPEWAPDVLHVNEFLPAVFATALYPRVPAVATVHSEYDCERPYVSGRIWHYICIRPSVRALLTQRYGVALARTTVIYNGVDAGRFAAAGHGPTAGPAARRVLFVGTIDPLRRRAIEDLIARGAREGFTVRVVGDRHAGYLDRPPRHVEVYPSTWEIERHVAVASATAGVLLGRSTIEGWFAGLPGWIYDIDVDGKVRSLEIVDPPPDLAKFAIANVADRVLELYESAIASDYMSDEALALECVGVAAALGVGRAAAVGADVGNMRAKIAAVRSRYAPAIRVAKSGQALSRRLLCRLARRP